MKLTRLILVCTLLLLASSPVFALPQCRECINNNRCEYTGNSFEVCTVVGGMCQFDPFKRCTTFAPEQPVMADWTVASIEISRPAPDTNTVTTPADATEVPATEPAKTK
ncbi:MAG TPA: hypothetical protein VE974_29615 [Thermoanaerobaculia bacterium]|nr:hypothetical protein [Thermoanaerobaculia bacterium]